MKKILIISPTYNEIENIQLFIDSVFNFADLSLLIVDDNSPDGTAEVVKSNIKKNKRLHLISRPKKLGLGTAYVAAFSWFLKSDYQYCVQMDCDFSHSFIDLKNLLAEINNSDLIIGSRYIKGGSTEGWGTYRKLLSKYANKLAKISLNSEIRDLTGGFKLMNREVISKILDSQPKSNGYTFQIEVNQLVEKNLFEIKEVPITFKERASGKSKMNFGIIVEAFFFLLKNFTNNIIK